MDSYFIFFGAGSVFQLSFSNVRTDGQEIQVIRILEKLVGKIGLGCWKRIRKIGNRLTLSAKGITSSLSKALLDFFPGI
jgi:hypothetical protein